MDQQDTVQLRILRAIRRIIRRTSEHARSMSRESGITVPQMLCMNAIATAGRETDVTVAMIAQTVQLSAPTTSRILDRLEKFGYVQRERGSTDRRKVYVTLTDQGRRCVRALPKPLHEQFLQRLNSIESSERTALLTALERIVELMDAESIDASPMLTPEIEEGTSATQKPL